MSRSRSSSPSAKRIKLEDFSPCAILKKDSADEEHSEPDDSENNCSICLQAVVDRTVVPKCSHEFCFECLLVWTGKNNCLCFVVLINIASQNSHADARYVRKV